MILIQLTAVRVDLNVIITGMTKYLCIHVAAAIAPEVKFTAISAKRNLTAVTENYSRNFPAAMTGGVAVFYYDHFSLN